jgi:hypothetical protein
MKRVVIQILLLFWGLPMLAQYDRVDSLLLDVFGNDKTISHLFDQPSTRSFIYSGITSDSRTFYAGRELSSNMYSINGNLYLFHSSGLYFGASGSWYSELDPGYSSTVITAGIRKPLNQKKNMSFRASYSRFFFNLSDSDTYVPFSNNLGAGLLLRNNWIGGSLSFNLLFGKEKGMNLTPGIFSNIRLARLGISGTILLTPELSAFIGSETIYETGSMKDPSSQTYITKEKYGLLNIQADLPVSIHIGNLSIEAVYSFNIPRTQESLFKYPVSSFFSFSIGYLLPLN